MLQRQPREHLLVTAAFESVNITTSYYKPKEQSTFFFQQSYTVSYTGVASKYWNTLPQKEASAILSALNCLSYNIGDIWKAM